MTHQNAGHYRAKHPPGTQVSSRIKKALCAQAQDDGISCDVAHKIAAELGVPPAEIGKGIDVNELRIQKCQLGLFGYGPDRKKLVQSAVSVAPDVKSTVNAALIDDRIPCIEVWRIADRLNLTRLALANACEAMKIKINKCQLGAF